MTELVLLAIFAFGIIAYRVTRDRTVLVITAIGLVGLLLGYGQ